MAVLDCESFDAAMGSVSTIYGVEKAEVEDFLMGIDLDKEYKTKAPPMTGNYYLHKLFESNFRVPVEPLESVCWFHLTRVPAGTEFREGILPLGNVLDRLWSMLLSIPLDAKVRSNLQILRHVIDERQYCEKVSGQTSQGPFAVLVRETAFHNNRAYLDLPEIIEDICNGYRDQFGCEIADQIAAALKPCIVKFESSRDTDYQLLVPTLYYCWSKLKKQEIDLFSNTCHDCGGEVVPRIAIRQIKFL